MITFLTGVPGSGKSYYAVDKIYNNFSPDKEAVRDKNSTFEVCYTNINEFNFDKVRNVYNLDFDDLKIKLIELHKFYKEKKDDDFLVAKCKEYEIYNALFVIDEAHNIFDVKDVVLIWWLSYHRHLFHEIILITQNLSLIESKYKSFSEFFYKAFPQSLTLIKTHFKYNVYCQSRMSLNSKSGSIKIKRNKKVFELYKSGDSINAQNVILKFLIFGVVLLLVLVGFFYWFISSKTPDNEKIENNASASVAAVVPVQYAAVASVPVQQIASVPYSALAQYSSPAPAPTIENILFNLNCSDVSCSNEDLNIPPELITYFVKEKKIKILYSKKVTSKYFKFYFDTTKDFYNYLKSTKGVKNEENFNSIATDKLTNQGG